MINPAILILPVLVTPGLENLSIDCTTAEPGWYSIEQLEPGEYSVQQHQSYAGAHDVYTTADVATVWLCAY